MADANPKVESLDEQVSGCAGVILFFIIGGGLIYSTLRGFF